MVVCLSSVHLPFPLVPSMHLLQLRADSTTIKCIHFSVLKIIIEHSSLRLICFTNSLTTFAFSVGIPMVKLKSTNGCVSVEEANAY